MEIEILGSREEFAGVRDEWNDLARRAETDHVFMRHEWFSTWIEHVFREGRLQVLLVRRDGRLVGAAPLRLLAPRRRGLTVRMLAFLKSGISPRCHFLIDPAEDPGPIFDALWRVPDWDVAELKGLPREEPLTASLIDHLRQRGVCVVEPGSRSPYQVMPETWEDFEKSRTKSYRKRFRNSYNRCRKVDGFEVLKIETAPEFEAVFDELLDISRNSWKAAGGTDLVSQAGMGEFYRAFARAAEDDRSWVLFLMRLDGRPAAFNFYVRHGTRWVALRSEYDDSLGYYMPGVVVHVAAIKDFLAGGGEELDLAGTDTVFKAGLVDSIREHVDLTFGNTGTKSRILMALKDTLVRCRAAGLLPEGL